ncbi:MAG: AAA family ATPase [Roseiflexaceae bacterium]
MLKSMHLKNLTVFPDINFTFGRNLNVIIGDNGSGKSHILKAAYSFIAVSAQRGVTNPEDTPTRSVLEVFIAEKLRNVFRPDDLGRLARRKQGQTTCEMSYSFEDEGYNISFQFSTRSKSEVAITKIPRKFIGKFPVFLPTRELLTIYPGFISLYENSYTQFEETWRDTCVLLANPLARGQRAKTIKSMLKVLEDAMGGSIELDKSGRFYLNTPDGNMEINLVAEGLRKLAMLARLIATGSLLDKGYLFWDEPESNLNPKIIKSIARTILQLSRSGIQVFIATHSLFLLRELHILQLSEFKNLESRYFGLHIEGNNMVSVQQGNTIDDVGDIVALDEHLQQSERYLDIQN